MLASAVQVKSNSSMFKLGKRCVTQQLVEISDLLNTNVQLGKSVDLKNHIQRRETGKSASSPKKEREK